MATVFSARAKLPPQILSLKDPNGIEKAAIPKIV
jgi:hypothetical protein